MVRPAKIIDHLKKHLTFILKYYKIILFNREVNMKRIISLTAVLSALLVCSADGTDTIPAAGADGGSVVRSQTQELVGRILSEAEFSVGVVRGKASEIPAYYETFEEIPDDTDRDMIRGGVYQLLVKESPLTKTTAGRKLEIGLLKCVEPSSGTRYMLWVHIFNYNRPGQREYVTTVGGYVATL
jgi:hypothetical protein